LIRAAVCTAQTAAASHPPLSFVLRGRIQSGCNAIQSGFSFHFSHSNAGRHMPTVPFNPAEATLQACWQRRRSFTLLDLDFDGGRRLLATIAALLRDPDRPGRLHYVAVMDELPDADSVARLAAATPGAAQLHQAWPPRVPGFHRLILADGRLSLTLAAGDLAANLPQLDLAFDACYCRAADATPALVLWLGRLAAPQAHLAVDARRCGAMPPAALREAIARAGFAECEASCAPAAPHDWTFRFAPRRTRRPDPAACRAIAEKRAIVIGAGLAGTAACHRLSARGWRCILIEQHAAPARQASGNAAGIFMPVLSKDDNPLSRLTRAAYLFALHLWDGLGGVGRALPGQACGVLQLARSDAAPGMPGAWDYPPDFVRWRDGADAGAALRQRVAGGWWFPAAGWLHPAAVCEAMLAACGDRLQAMYGHQAAQLMPADDDQWDVLDASGRSIARAPVVILANGMQAAQFAQAADLPLTAVRGQVTHLPAQAADLPFVLCGDAYLTPAAHGIASLGATYDADADASLRLDSQLENIRHLQQMLPDWRPPAPAALDGRVGFRCVTADRLPLVGALADPAQLAGSGDTRLRDMPRLPGLHGLLGYGSRGLIWSPLAAELLAAQLEGEPLPLPRDLAALLDPARFALKRRRRA
jgi:tRNA 5-methylaminomethyl-2-thiouridine biosynthesis bifunctional protein